MAQLTNNMKYEFPDELWGIIKEYAGVYHIGTDWKKLGNIGVVTIHDHYRDEYNIYITHYKTEPKETKKMIFKNIFEEYKNKENMTKLYKLITDKYPKNKVSTNFNCKVGDQIRYISNDYKQSTFVGVVTKINKSTISFKPYKIDRKVRDLDAFRKQTFEYIRYYFDKNNFEKVKTIKNFDLDDSDYFEEVVDWGR